MHETWWCVHPGCLEAGGALGQRGIRSVVDATRAEGRVLSTDRQSAAVLLEGPPPLLLKWRHPHGTRRIVKAWGRPSRERREARVALGARARGIATPAPLAVGERRSLARLVGAVLARPYFPHMEPADEALDREAALGEVLAAHLRAWHDRGLRHGDCYPKNVLVGPDAREAWPIGFPRARLVAPGPGLDRARLRDLGQWAAGLATRPGAPADPDAALAFLGPYARLPGLPTPERLAALFRPFLDRVLARKARRLATRPRREPDGPPPPPPLPAHTEPASVSPRAYGARLRITMLPLADLEPRRAAYRP